MATTDIPRANGRAVSRSFIVHRLWQADEDDHLEQVSRRSTTTSNDASSVASSEDELGTTNESADDELLPANATLEETMSWLDVQCKREQAKVDWEPEYGHRTTENHVPSEGPNVAVLQRIRRGHGPRSSKFEDLIAPLRLTDGGEAPRFSKRPLKDTCEDLEVVLRDWNEHVASAAEDDIGAREVLMDAMRDRIVFLDRALISRWSADAHDDTCRKLLLAIHVYRPETAEFDTKDPMDLLIIILAHLGYAIPDIDYDLKYRMLYTLVTERRYSAGALAANVKTRRRYEKSIVEAKKRGDLTRAMKYENEMDAWVRAGLQKNCDVIIQKVKNARRNIELKVLQEQQDLAVLQAAQKLVLKDRIANGKPPIGDLIPRFVWWPARADARALADSKLEENTNGHLEYLQASYRVTAGTVDEMKDTSHARVLTRAMKFAGFDLENITEVEREDVVRARMAHPGTVTMMWDALQGLAEINSKAKETVEFTTNMDRKLEDMLSAIVPVHDEYTDLWKLVDSDPHM